MTNCNRCDLEVSLTPGGTIPEHHEGGHPCPGSGAQYEAPASTPPARTTGAPVDSERLVVSYGAGVDSTAALIALYLHGIRPDMIVFANVGNEWPETYAYIPVMNAWLRSVGFPEVTIVKNPRPKSGDASLGDACKRLGVLPALAYGQHQCSLVWKVDPQEKIVRKTFGWNGRKKTWAEGVERVVKVIGYDAGTRDACRAGKAHGKDSKGFRNWYPLIEWGIDREQCIALIEMAGLPVPRKSSCFFCPAMKRDEIIDLGQKHPELLMYAIEIEDLAIAKGLRGGTRGLGRKLNWRELATAAGQIVETVEQNAA